MKSRSTGSVTPKGRSGTKYDVPSPGMLSPEVYNIVKTAYQHMNEPTTRKSLISAKGNSGPKNTIIAQKVDALIQERDEAVQKAMVLTMLYEEESSKNDDFIAQLLRLLPESEREKMLNSICGNDCEVEGTEGGEQRKSSSPTTVQETANEEFHENEVSTPPAAKTAAERDMNSIIKKARALLDAESPMPPTVEPTTAVPAPDAAAAAAEPAPVPVDCVAVTPARNANASENNPTAAAVTEPLQHIVRALSAEMEQRQATITAQAAYLTLAADQIAKSAMERADCMVEVMKLQQQLEEMNEKLAKEQKAGPWWRRWFSGSKA